MTNPIVLLAAFALLSGCMTVPDYPAEPTPYEVIPCADEGADWNACDVFYMTAADPGHTYITRTYVCEYGFDNALLRVVNLYKKRIPVRHVLLEPSICWASATPPFMN